LYDNISYSAYYLASYPSVSLKSELPIAFAAVALPLPDYLLEKEGPSSFT
jgi:hypothetical protein